MKYLPFLKHIFEEPHEKSHEKIFKSNAPPVPALPQIRDFQECFLREDFKKKTIFYPPLVDKGFTPPPLFTAIKVSVITLN